MTTSPYLSGEEYRAACERYREVVVSRAAGLAAEIRSTGRRLRVGHFVTVPEQYFPRLAEAFYRVRDTVDYQVIYTAAEDEWVTRMRTTGIEVFNSADRNRAAAENFDVMFIQHPYYAIGDVAIDFYGIMRHLPDYLFPGGADQNPLICFIPYAYTAIDEAVHKPVNGFHDLPVHNVAWRVYCETPSHLKQARSGSSLRAWNWRATGYPKLDDIRDACEARRSHKGREAETGDDSRTIIWAPHHNRHFQTVSIEHMHAYFAGLLAEDRTLRLILRPHPNLTRPGGFDFSLIGLTPERFGEIMKFWSDHPRGEVDLGADLAGLFARSSAMVTDCGGFQAEYFVSGRPLISHITERMLSPFMKRLMRRGNYRAETLVEVDVALRRVLNGEGRGKRRARLRAIRTIQPSRDASGAIVADLVGSMR